MVKKENEYFGVIKVMSQLGEFYMLFRDRQDYSFMERLLAKKGIGLEFKETYGIIRQLGEGAFAKVFKTRKLNNVEELVREGKAQLVDLTTYGQQQTRQNITLDSLKKMKNVNQSLNKLNNKGLGESFRVPFKETDYAVKVFSKKKFREKDLLELVIHEVQVLKKLNH